jgi:hypothetical protein
MGLEGSPPRLPGQPIFYPVLNFDYAKQIARDWNTMSPSRSGYVTRFEVDDHVLGKYEPHIVGGKEHMELWVPAEELGEFNSHIKQPIRIASSFFAEDFNPTTTFKLDYLSKLNILPSKTLT